MPVTAEELFLQHFWPLYPADAKANLARARTSDANPGKNPAVLAHLDEAAQVFATRAPILFGSTALALDFSDASVHRLSAAVTRERRDGWREAGERGTAENELFNVVAHGCAYVGACVLRGASRDARFSVRRPLWESLVTLRSRAGDAELAIFQWWLKSLADDAFAGHGGTLADRYRTHVESPTASVDDLPLLAPPDRRVPRLAKVRYDALYKHLRAHLPELRDVGTDFPPPARLEEMRFKWLDFLLVGRGRMLLVFGPGEGGIHLFWLDAGGFQKGTFFPADAFPEPIVREENGKLFVLLSCEGRTLSHEMLWWGS